MLSGNIIDPTIINNIVKNNDPKPIYDGLSKFMPKAFLIGSNPITAEKPHKRDKIAPLELALSQYRPNTTTEIAPVKYTAPVIPK